MLLCIDWAGEKVKIARVEDGHGEIQVDEAREIDTSDLGRYLRNIAGKIKEIRVAVPIEKSFHKTFMVPNISGNLLNQAIAHEVKKSFGRNYQFKYTDLGEVVVPNTRVNKRIMTVGVERETLEELSLVFAHLSVRPKIYTTYPVALLALLDKVGMLSAESMGFVEMSYPKSRIVIFKGREIRLTRELPLSEGDKDQENIFLAKDIQRTLLFYTESFPGESVANLLVLGKFITPDILESLKQKTGANIIPFSSQPFFQDIEDGSEIYPGCLGLAITSPPDTHFQFTPFSIKEKKKIKRTVSLFSSVFLGLVLIFGLIIFRFSLDLRQLNIYRQGIKGEIKMKEDRMKELSSELVSHSLEISQPHWSETLLELAAVIPAGVSINSMTIKKDKHEWVGEVGGSVEGTDQFASLYLVEQFQYNLLQSPLFSKARIVDKKMEEENIIFKIEYQLRT